MQSRSNVVKRESFGNYIDSVTESVCKCRHETKNFFLKCGSQTNIGLLKMIWVIRNWCTIKIKKKQNNLKPSRKLFTDRNTHIASKWRSCHRLRCKRLGWAPLQPGPPAYRGILRRTWEQSERRIHICRTTNMVRIEHVHTKVTRLPGHFSWFHVSVCNRFENSHICYTPVV
jgi:hypothetical protein